MKKTITYTFTLLLGLLLQLTTTPLSIAKPSKEPFTYPNGAKHAISITFDDARPSQIDFGVSILNKHNVKATFYIMPFQVEKRLTAWQQVVKQGHEIGNHTTSHLCTGNFTWLRKQGLGLEQVTLAWLEQDILTTNRFIKEQFGVSASSFAYPCGNTFVGRGSNVKSYVPLIAKYFTTGRTWLDETANDPHYTDFSQLTALKIDGLTFEQMKTLIDTHKEQNKWLILAAHEVGEKGPYSVDKEALNKLLVYLKAPQNNYWLDTVKNVSRYIQTKRSETSFHNNQIK